MRHRDIYYAWFSCLVQSIVSLKWQTNWMWRRCSKRRLRSR